MTEQHKDEFWPEEAVCESCGEPCKYDSELCLCSKCETSKRCKECGLRVRCGSLRQHIKGWHHQHRLETLGRQAKASPK